MKYWFLAAIFVVACAAPMSQTGSQTGSPASSQTSASSSSSTSSPAYADARSTASDAEVRDARRAYRAACEQHQSTGYCECMTGGMAQALPPAELAVATAAFTGQTVQASSSVRDHVAAVRTDVDRGCAQFRRG